MYKNIFLGALPVIFIIIFVNCKRDAEKEQSLRNVVLVSSEGVSGNSISDYNGIIEEGAFVNAAFMADGKISGIHVKEGDRVSKGQLIATLDDTDYKIGLSQLETQLAQMTKEKERMDAMFEKHNIAPNDYEKFEAGYKQLNLQLEMAKRQLGYTRLYSPSNGYVSAKYLNEGELTGAGTPVVNITDDSSLYAAVDLPVQAYLNKEKIVSVVGYVPGIPGDIQLSIVSFTPEADNSMLYRLKLSIPSAFSRQLTPGMNISVRISYNETDTTETLIPSRAIFGEEGVSYVWVFEPKDSTIHKKRVHIEGVPSGRMSVVKGLDDNERIVETGVRQLFEGEKVNVLNRNDIGM